MYSNTKKIPVKPYFTGLGQIEVDPQKTAAATGSVFVFIFSAPGAIATDVWNALGKDLMQIGKEWWKWMFGTTLYEVQGAGYSNGQIRIWVVFRSDENRAVAELIPTLKAVLDKYLGKGTCSYQKTILMSGQSAEIKSTVEKVIESTVGAVAKGVGIELKKLVVPALIIAGAYFLIPPVIRELKKK